MKIVRANKNWNQVLKVTISTVKYVKSSVSSLLVLKAICANMSKPAAPQHDIHLNQSNQQCPVGGKICHNLASLKNHLRVHTT